MILPFFRVKYQLTQLGLLIFGVVFSLYINYSEKINFYISAYTVCNVHRFACSVEDILSRLLHLTKKDLNRKQPALQNRPY